MSDRLEALRRSRLLDTEPEEAFDRITRIATRLVRAPAAAVSLIEPHRQFNKSLAGLGPAESAAREAPLSHSFCQHVVRHNAPFIVRDAAKHPLVYDNLARVEFGLEAYLGVPFRAPTGEVLGSLCVFDFEPRTWAPEDAEALNDLARVLTEELVLREEIRMRERVEQANAAIRRLKDASIDAITDLFFVIDLDARLVEWNRRCADVTGYSDVQLAGLNVLCFFGAADQVRIAEAIERAIREGTAVQEAVLVTAEGQEIPYEFSATAIFNDRGDLTGLCGTGRDITERMRTQALQQKQARTLQASEARFRSFVEATAQAVWQADETGYIVELSDAWSEFTGQTPDEIEGWGWTDAIHPDDLPWVVEEWSEHIAQRTPYAPTFRVRRRDGVYHRFSTRAVPAYDGDTFLGWMGTCTDVEAQRQAQENLIRSEERLRLALDAGEMGTWDTDLRADTVAWSPQTLALFGFGDEPFDGHKSTFYDRIVEEDRERVGAETSAAIQRAQGGGPTELAIEYRLRRRDGEVRWFRSTGRVVLGAGGTAERMIGTVLDVTDEKDRHAVLIRAKEEAEAAARAKTALLANMSHEIRTPLTSIIGFADVLAEEIPDEQEEFARVIGRSGRRLLHTLNSVLDLAQIEAGRYQLALTTFDAAAAACEAASILRLQAETKGLTLDCRRPDVPLLIRADAGAFGRVVTNLVSNAVKFTDAGGVTVTVGRADGPGDLAEIRVEDTGRGIAEAFLAHLFDEFRQESEGDGREFEGNGLGLSITRRLVEMMGGTIHVESEQGVGSMFTVRLPLDASASSDPLPSAHSGD